VKLMMVADISGRVCQEKRNADRITAAALCLPGGSNAQLRKRLPAEFPKWRDATDADVGFAVDIIVREALAAVVYSIDKDTPAWDAFWSDAREIQSRTRGKISFIKAAAQIKCLLFVKSTTLACAHGIKIGNIPRMIGLHKDLTTHESLVFDKEIEGVDNIQAFKAIWERANAFQPMTESLGIKRRIVAVDLLTEQEEPLLMFADYAAGIAHAALSEVDTLAQSRVSAKAAYDAHQRLLTARNYLEMSETFSLRFDEIVPWMEEI
jgi:hypothetical protein